MYSSVADRFFSTGGAGFDTADVSGLSNGVNRSIACIYWFSSPRAQSRLGIFITTRCRISSCESLVFEGVNCAETTFLVLGYCAHRNQCDLVYAPRCALWLHLSGKHRCFILYSLLSRYSRERIRVSLDLDDLPGDHHHFAWDPSWLGFVASRCSTER